MSYLLLVLSACGHARAGAGHADSEAGAAVSVAGRGGEAPAGAAAAVGGRAGAAPNRPGGSADEDAGATRLADAGSAPPPRAANAVDGPNGAAFDPAIGRLDVDYASYLSQHDVVYNAPNRDPLRGLTVGNGRVGAIVWSDGGLQMQLANVDGSEQTAFALGRASLSTQPALEAGAPFQQRLALYDGVLTTHYGSDCSVTIMGSPRSELLGIHVEDHRPDVSSIQFALNVWDVSQLANSGAVRDLSSWKVVVPYADATSAGLSRGQSDPDHFGSTLAATVEGAPFTTALAADGGVSLTITPSASYTIWIAGASRIRAPSHDSVAEAKRVLDAASTRGYADTLLDDHGFWHDFWSRSFVQYHDSKGDADYLENIYYLATYMIAAGGYGTYPFHFINGVFRATADQTKWSNAYWYWNERYVYNSFFASNHPELIRTWNALYADQRDELTADTKKRYGIDGLWVPETMGWNGNADATVNSDFTKNIFSTGTEAAMNMVRYYQYTGDEGYLRDTAYPFVRAVAEFYRSKLSVDSSGQYYMASSNAHETYWNVRDAITDLAAVRGLFPIALRLSAQLGLDLTAREGWQNVLDHLAPYPSDDSDYLPNDPPMSESHNGENVACEIIWPYDQTGIGASDYARALHTWQHRPNPYGNVWANDSVQAARLGLGMDALSGMTTMLSKYQSYPNGMTNNDNGVFEYLGVHLAALNESLLQSYDGKLRVFPALPKDSSFIARFTLAAVGGVLVSAEREADETKYVGLRSLRGNPITIVNPWPGAAIQVRRSADDAIVAQAAGAELSFASAVDTSYVVERVSRLFGSYEPAHLAATANQDIKHLPGTSCSLGIAR